MKRNALSNNQKAVKMYYDRVDIDAQIVLLFHAVMSGQSINSNDDCPELFLRMFPDSKIARSFNMKKDKVHY